MNGYGEHEADFTGYDRMFGPADVEPCADCGRPVEYVDDQWRHVDPTVECFLYRARA